MPLKVRDVFVAAHGQDDNVGDPALRRAMLDGLAPHSRRHVLVGTASEAYVNALGLRVDDLRYDSRRQWQAAAFRSALRGRASFVSNAGEIQLNRRRLRINRADRALIAVIRARGGVAISTGLGIRDPKAPSSRVLTSLVRACQIATWRDEESRSFARAGEVRPDWAFALGTDRSSLTTDDRPYLLVSMRGDAPPPSAEWVETIKAIQAELGLSLRTVSQVERDVAPGLTLSGALHSEVVPWRAGDHLAAEMELRGHYRSARVVISDRLHVLVFAATEGAIPLYIPNVNSTKIPRTMAVAGLGEYRADAGDQAEAVSRAVALSATQNDVLARVETARVDLAALTESMNALLEPAGSE